MTRDYQLWHLLSCPDILDLPASSLEHSENLVDETFFEAAVKIEGRKNFSVDKRHHLACSKLAQNIGEINDVPIKYWSGLPLRYIYPFYLDALEPVTLFPQS